MTRERLHLFDTTLRDGQQTQGADFSAADKVIARAFDDLGRQCGARLATVTFIPLNPTEYLGQAGA